MSRWSAIHAHHCYQQCLSLEEHTFKDTDVEAERGTHLKTTKKALQSVHGRMMVMRFKLVYGMDAASDEEYETETTGVDALSDV
jgi:hypothetical protein